MSMNDLPSLLRSPKKLFYMRKPDLAMSESCRSDIRAPSLTCCHRREQTMLAPRSFFSLLPILTHEFDRVLGP